jgi:toxin ParE1/3/4
LIQVDNPAAASRVIRAIREEVRLLAENPLMGRVGGVVGTRELVVRAYPYIVIYRVGAEAVRVLAVIHTSRHWHPGFDRE